MSKYLVPIVLGLFSAVVVFFAAPQMVYAQDEQPDVVIARSEGDVIVAASNGCYEKTEVPWYSQSKNGRVVVKEVANGSCPQIDFDMRVSHTLTGTPYLQWSGSAPAGLSGEKKLYDAPTYTAVGDFIALRKFMEGKLVELIVIRVSTDHSPSWMWYAASPTPNAQQCFRLEGQHDPWGNFWVYVSGTLNLLTHKLFNLPDKNWQTPWFTAEDLANAPMLDIHGILSQDVTTSGEPAGNIRNDSWFTNIANPCFVGTPGIVLKKFTNGADADSANGVDVPQIEPASNVTWTYLVTNTGNIAFALNEVNVTDDQPGVHPVFDSSSDNGDSVLSPGETWTYVAVLPAEDLLHSTSGATIVPGCDPSNTGLVRPTYENVGTVHVRDLTDADPSHYCNVAHPDVQGQTVWNVDVWNPGNVDLKDAQWQLVDAKCQQVIGDLKAGARVHIECSGKLIVTATSIVGAVQDVFEMVEGITPIEAPACTTQPASFTATNWLYLPVVGR